MKKISDEGVILNHQLKTVSHRGVSTKGRALVIKYYICIDVTVRCINLNIVRLTNYQDELHDSGLGYRRIAY